MAASAGQLSPRYITPAVIAGVTLFTVVAFFSLQDGHDWGGDFALYISHAINIATGRPYGDTGYIPNPMYLYLSPAIYPPATPVILSVVYALFGLDFIAMKAALFLFFSATVVLVYVYYRGHTTLVAAGLIAVATSLNPFVWTSSNAILSEFPFLFFFFLSLLLLDRREKAATLRLRLVLAVCAGIAAYFASATREIGVVLIPAVLLYDLLQHRKISRDTVAFIFVFAAGYAGQNLLFDLSLSDAYDEGTAGYASLFLGWTNTARNFLYYAISVGHLFPVPYRDVLTYPFLGFLFVLASLGVFREWTRFLPRQGAVGLVTGLARGIRLQDITAAGYVMAILLQPFFGGTRYLLPLMPIFLFYVVVGAQHALERMTRPSARSSARASAALLLGILLYHSAYYLTAKPAQATIGVHNPQSVQMFAAVRTLTPKDAIVVFRKPRVMALFGQRRSTVWPQASDDRSLWQNLSDLQATYVVATRPASGVRELGYMPDFSASPMPFLESVFANDHFTVYRIIRFP